MSTSSFLADLWQRGVVLRLSEDGSRILVRRSQIGPETRARLTQDKIEILKLLGYVDEYRGLIRNAFAIMVQSEATHSGLSAFAEDQARLTDELGPTLTLAIRDVEARQWTRETGLCPVCGGDEQGCNSCEEMDESDPTH
jgi:hypothetical protein